MIVTAGSANISVYYYIVQDASATSPGEPVTGLLFSDIETGGSASFVRQGAARVDLTLITLASASATHADGGFILVDDTNMPGLYRCDYPDAAFVTGVDQVMLQIVVASAKNAVASPIFVEITDVDLRDSVRAGLTALPSAAADAAGGLPISDAGGLALDSRLDADISSRLAPTVASRTLDITATGAAGIDWANVENQSTTVGLSGTTVGITSVNSDMRGTDGANIVVPPSVSQFNARTIVSASYATASNLATVDANIDILLDALIMQTTTIATLASQTSFTLTAGSVDNAAYEAATIVIVDSATSVQKAFGSLSDYTGATKTVTLAQDPAIFTMAVGDTVHILPSDTFAIIDRLLLGSTHNVMNSLGKRIRDLGGFAIRSGTAQGAGTGNNQIQFDAGASAVDGAYDPAGVLLVGGLQDGQSRLILQYNGATKTATVDRNWKVNPTASTDFVIIANPGREHVNEGLAQAGTSTTITLNTLASAADDTYIGQTVFLRSGTGDDQARLIIDYNGTTKVATIDRVWDVIPDTTSGYVMLPTALRTNQDIVDAVWNELQSGHTTAGSFGKFLDVEVSSVSGGGGLTQQNVRDAMKLTPTAGSPATGSVDEHLDDILTDTGTTLPTTISGIPDLTLAAGDIDGFSLENAQKIALAAVAGKLSGAATSTNIIRAADDSKARITATVDADGNRTAITLDGTG